MECSTVQDVCEIRIVNKLDSINEHWIKMGSDILDFLTDDDLLDIGGTNTSERSLLSM